jgi:adenine phosphoribosyltransferase
MSRPQIDLETFIRNVPDFPKPGIMFKDITPMLQSAPAFDHCIAQLIGPFRDQRINKIAAVESRGFIFGACVARELQCGFVPIRKPGKLPWTTRRHEYTLEYGTDALEMHDDAVGAGDRVLIVDDVLATGGTAAAAVELVRYFDAEVAGLSFLIELGFLNGRERLPGVPVHSVLHYS